MRRSRNSRPGAGSMSSRFTRCWAACSRPTVQGFLIDLMAHDPAQLAAATDLPMLIVHGGNDLQIGDADAAALRAGAPDAEFVEIDAMNHVFKDMPADDPFANRASYADASLPVAPPWSRRSPSSSRATAGQENERA